MSRSDWCTGLWSNQCPLLNLVSKRALCVAKVARSSGLSSLHVCWGIFNNPNDSQSQARAAEINRPPRHPQWWDTACRGKPTHIKNTLTLLFTQNTLIRMRAIAGGPPFPLWYTNRRTHTHSDTQTEYLVCNRIRRNLKAQKHLHGAYRHRWGNK